MENVQIVQKIFREMSESSKVTVGFEWPQSLVDDPDSADEALLDDGRFSPTHKELLINLKSEGVQVFGFDIEKKDWQSIEDKDISWRDEQMARVVNNVLEKLDVQEKLLLVCGDAHFQAQKSIVRVKSELKEFTPMAMRLKTPSILAIHLKYLSGHYWNFGLKEIRTYEIDKARCFRKTDEVVEYEIATATPVRHM